MTDSRPETDPAAASGEDPAETGTGTATPSGAAAIGAPPPAKAAGTGAEAGASRPVRAGWIQLEPWVGAAEQVAGLLHPPQPLPQAVPLRCWSARPSSGSPRGGVLVLPEVFGINAWVRSITERLAAAGYLALAMPLFARTAPTLELGYGPDTLQEGRHHKERTSAAGILLDAASACTWLTAQLGRSGGLGCVGFCFGGHAALIASLLPSIAATVDAYGAGVASGRPGGGPPSLELLPAINGRLLCFCGRHDPLIPRADVDALAAALRGVGRTPAHRLLEFEAGHGFLCDQRADHVPAAAAEAWGALLAFLAEELGGGGAGALGLGGST